MNDYQNYLNDLIQQPLAAKRESLMSEIRDLMAEKQGVIETFRGVSKEIAGVIRQPDATVEDLSAFLEKLKKRLPQLARLNVRLKDLRQYQTISDTLKQTIGNLGDYCMNNLSLDEILKASEGTENLKQQAEEQKTAFEELQTAYMVNETLVGFFGGVDQQFKKLMQYENINAGTVNTFMGLFSQYAEVLAGLKFQISRMKNEAFDQNPELKQLAAYCRQEMTIQEAGHCRDEMERIQEAGRKRLAELAEQKRKDEIRRQEAEKKRQAELKRQEEERIKRNGWLIDNGDGTVSDPKTGLMWAADDNGYDITWDDAKMYCEKYRGGGYSDWRMPTINELQRLYKSGCGYETSIGYTAHISALIRLTSPVIWSSETDGGSSAAFFHFDDGKRTSYRRSYTDNFRALPVRSGK